MLVLLTLIVLVPQVSVVLLFNVDEQKALGDRQGSQVWLMRGVKLGPDTRHNPRGTRGGGVWVCFFKKKCNLLSAEIGNEGAMGHCTLHSLHHAYACRLSQAHVQGSEAARRGGTGILQQFALTQ